MITKPHIAGSIGNWLVFAHDRPMVLNCGTWDDVLTAVEYLHAVPPDVSIEQVAQADNGHYVTLH